MNGCLWGNMETEREQMMYKLAFCDDNIEFMNHIVERVISYGNEKSITFDIQKFSDSDSLLEQIEEKKLFDVYFLDVDMPNYNGIDVSRKIRDYTSTALIIFITAYDSYAIDACGINVVRYILKNRIDKDIIGALDELMVRLAQIYNEKVYVISNQRKYLKILQKDIVYMYKYQKNTIFVMLDGSEEKDRITLQDAYDKMNNPDMIWLDRCVILNRSHIWKVSNEKIIMDGGYEITAGDGRIKDIKKKLSEYWRELL